MTDATVSLHMIVKDETGPVFQLLQSAVSYFTDIYVTVSDKDAYYLLENEVDAVMWKNVHVDHRDWTGKFDEARNHSFALGDSTYQFWLDADDTFDFRAIPHLVKVAEQGGYDQILLPYNYAQDENGQSITMHWRERLIRRSHGFIWKGWVHETPVTDTPFTATRENIPVTHNVGPDHAKTSLERNHAILEQAIAESDDPRYKMYYGRSLHSLGKWGEAIVVLDEFTKVSGSEEDIYQALCTMSEGAYLMGKTQAALNYAIQAAGLIPRYPQAFWLLAQWEADSENWEQGLEWVRVGNSKPDPNGIMVFDPSARYRACLIAAQCEFMLQNYNNALAWLRKVPANDKSRIDLEDGFVKEADAETFVKLLPKLRQYFESDKALYEALCYDLKYDARLRGLRDIVTPPTTWTEKSIVIFCGKGYEEWGPHTLDRGMGGSEEAVVYLSRELAKLGYNVTVYAEFEGSDRGVTYLPWKEINVRDHFNIFVSWRAPQYLEKIRAKVKLADIHDVLPEQTIKNYPDVTYLVKSAYHRALYPEVPDDKFKIIGNGIVKGQFDAKES